MTEFPTGAAFLKISLRKKRRFADVICKLRVYDYTYIFDSICHKKQGGTAVIPSLAAGAAGAAGIMYIQSVFCCAEGTFLLYR